MNKTEFVRELESRCDTDIASRAALLRLIDAGQNIIKETLAAGESVAFAGFGTFVPVKRSAHAGVNPATGESMEIPATVVPKFKPGKTFKDAVKDAIDVIE